MTKKFTLIYQFNSFNYSAPTIFDLQEFLAEEKKFRKEFKKLHLTRLKSPPIKILQQN